MGPFEAPQEGRLSCRRQLTLLACTAHEDLWASWWRNTDPRNEQGSEWPLNCHDGIDNDGNGYADDCFGYVGAAQKPLFQSWPFATQTPQRAVCTQDFSTRSGAPSALSGRHGTAVAGSCCATTNNGKGVASVGWGLRPLALKIDVRQTGSANSDRLRTDKAKSSLG